MLPKENPMNQMKYECEVCKQMKTQNAMAVINHLAIICIACNLLEEPLLEEHHLEEIISLELLLKE